MCRRNIDLLPLVLPQPGTWPTAQVCALTGNQASDLSVCRTMPSPLSHASQGYPHFNEALKVEQLAQVTKVSVI